MKVLLLSCLIYFISVAIVLYFRPSLMFQKNGNWKEFGLSSSETHTWFPFWLYCIVSAFLSYGISYLVCSVGGDSNSIEVGTVEVEVEETPISKPKPTNTKGKKAKNNAKSGYYVLDKESYEEDGIPKYVFIGSELPNENE